ncbi:flagellar basal body-associated protein FliL [Kibdelosporangium banguiense]|uniref:Flagellar basal body-associated protein FliL n=1 Tax=Kibdelosporangium banguiense TaxID=1365924 RepID=A0ABS4TMP5_9PSEU|nr:DUF4333 domain-containing protein [Kibdelosporangium banguiense]MBP2325682.1 flagellar basal body-associated protein FliL [Kibdelosporangium banguiense]
MSSPYGPGGNDPQQWGQQPQQPPQQPYGPPSGGFPAQPGGYPQQQPGQQPQYGGYPQQPPPQQPTQPYSPQQDPGSAGFPQQPQYGQDPASGGFPQQQQPYGQQPQYPGYGQQPQQPYGGYQQQPYGQPPPKKKSNAGLWIGVVVAVIVVAAVGVLGFVTPGFFNKKVLDQNAVQAGVVKILKDRYQEEATDVKCPADQEVKVGKSFTCDLKVGGEARTVTITIKTESDAQYEVSQSKSK